MKEIYYATTNKGKVQSLSASLEPHNIKVIQTSFEIPEPRTEDVEEISRVKVKYAYNELRKPCVALDAGFFIPSLNGFPKAFVNFALETIGIGGILKLVEGKERSCEFRLSMAYRDARIEEPKLFVEHVPGNLALKPQGEMKKFHWSPLALIFIPEGYNKTLGEFTMEDYAAWRDKERANSYSENFAKWFLSK